MRQISNDLVDIRNLITYCNKKFGQILDWPVMQIVIVRDKLIHVIAMLKAHKLVNPFCNEMDNTEQQMLDTLELFDLRQFVEC